MNDGIYNVGVYGDVNSATWAQLGVVSFESLVWEERYLETGEMQLVVPITPANVELFQLGRAVGIGKSSTLMYIHTIQYKNDKMWIYGYEAKQLLAKIAIVLLQQAATDDGQVTPATRIVYVWQGMSNWAEMTAAPQWLNPVTLSLFPVDSAWRYQAVDGAISKSDIVDFLDLFARYCVETGYGLKLNLLSTGKLGISLYNGIDRSSQVVFSPVLGNMDNAEYTISDEPYYNAVIALSTTTAGSLYQATDADVPAGEMERAYLLDERESFPYTDDMADGISLLEWTRQLRTKAHMSRIARHRTAKIKYGAVSATGFGTEYFLGDIVQVVIPAYNVSVQQRIEAVKYTAEYGKFTTEITLDNV